MKLAYTRKSVGFGILGAAIVFLPPGAAALFAAGMTDCASCDPNPFLKEALLLAALYAALFGVVASLATAAVSPRLAGRVRPAGATMVMALAIAVFAIARSASSRPK